MLKAIDLSSGDAEVYGWDAVRRGSYACPVCRNAVTPKKGAKVIHHFAHRGDSNCVFGRGESVRHMTLKRQVAEYLQAACTAVVAIDYEVRLIPGYVADIVIGLDHGTHRSRVVVECQVSPIAWNVWRQRTAAYSRAGFPVMWVWDTRRIPLRTRLHYVTGAEIHEARAPLEILYTNGCGHDLYVADDAGILRVYKLHEVFRDCSGCDGTGHLYSGDVCEFCGGEGGRALKSTKEIDRQTMPRYFSTLEERRWRELRFAHIDLSEASDEDYEGWLSLQTRIQLEPQRVS